MKSIAIMEDKHFLNSFFSNGEVPTASNYTYNLVFWSKVRVSEVRAHLQDACHEVPARIWLPPQSFISVQIWEGSISSTKSPKHYKNAKKKYHSKNHLILIIMKSFNELFLKFLCQNFVKYFSLITEFLSIYLVFWLQFRNRNVRNLQIEKTEVILQFYIFLIFWYSGTDLIYFIILYAFCLRQ